MVFRDDSYTRCLPVSIGAQVKKIRAGNVTELFGGVGGRNEFETSSLDLYAKFERNRRWSNCLIDSRCPEDSAVKEIAPGKIRAGIVIVGNRNNQFSFETSKQLLGFRHGSNCSN